MLHLSETRSTATSTYHLPSHRLLQLNKTTVLSLKPLNHRTPLKGLTVFTDGSGKTGKTIVTWKNDNSWQTLEGHNSGSPQLLELRAIIMVFQHFPHVSLNIVTDSAYVADIAQRLNQALLKEIDNAALFELLKTLWHTIQARTCHYYILHIRSHINLPGFIAEGNAWADWLTSPVWTASQPDMLVKARASHALFHQGV